MKLRTKSLFSLALLILLVVGTFALINPASSIITVDDVKVTPKYLNMLNTPSLDVRITLTDSDGSTLVEEIDPDTVTLENTISPAQTEIGYNTQGKPVAFHAKFSSSAMTGLLWTLLSHLEITMPKTWISLPLSLTISGALYNGTLWEGEALVKIVGWDIVNPLP
jgi:hypothetical protein